MIQLLDNDPVCGHAPVGMAAPERTPALAGPHSLRTEQHVNPLGLGCARPRLSWKLPVEIGGRRVVRQVAWQVRVSGAFDTGRRTGSGSVFVEWPGETLRSRQRASWQVRVWVCVGEEDAVVATGWSDAAVFETGLLARDDWAARWIGYGDEGKTDTPPSPFLRRGFLLEAEPVRARLYAAALGLFEFRMNGEPVHPEVVLAGGWTDFRKRVQSYAFDVTALVRRGENVLGAILADGWYAGYLSCDGKRHIYGGAPALLAQLEIECADGSVVRVVSDGSWEGRTGPIVSADLYHGEHYDARLELAGWCGEAPEETGAKESVHMGRKPLPLPDHGLEARATWRAGRPLTRDQKPEDREQKSEDGSQAVAVGCLSSDFCLLTSELRAGRPRHTEGWTPVDERAWPEGLLIEPRVAEPVRRIGERVTHAVTEPSAGVYIFDFGQNFSGWARLRRAGRRGQRVVLRFGEMLNADGTLYTANLRTARATDAYTFGRDETVEWEPRFTFHGFRYVEVRGLELAAGELPGPDVITGVVVHNDMRETGAFRCSDERVNQLAENIRWSLRSNFLEIPSDCPQRDERLGWSGDIQIFAKTAAFFYDTDAFLTKWMRDLRDGQLADGAFPDLAPTFICGFGNAAWADAGVIVPWVLYRRFGDVSVLEENYAAMCAWMRFQEATSRDGVRPPTVYGDWLALDAVKPEHAPVPSDFVGTAYFARTCAIMARVARLLGHEEDARGFAALDRRVRAAFRREFVTAGGRLAGECQTAYALALAFDLLPPAWRAGAVDRLAGLIGKHGGHLSTGFVGTPLLCPVLSRFGRHDVAMRLLLNDTYPSWLYTVKQGATTLWERWNSFSHEHGFGDAGMNSFNHYAFGAIGEWLIHFVAGIAPGQSAPAYRHIVFRPQPCAGLDRAEAELETPYGQATIAWRVEGRRMEGVLRVPPGAFADFEGGVFSRSQVRPQDGTESWAEAGGERMRLRAGRYVFDGVW